jgi:hypothetical protein
MVDPVQIKKLAGLYQSFGKNGRCSAEAAIKAAATLAACCYKFRL